MPTTSRRHLLQLLPAALGGPLAASCAAPPVLRAPTLQAALPQVSAGRLERLPAIASRHVAARPVDVWLPPGYDPSRRHAVLYMHDGQMLFDASMTWNRQAWQVDAVAGRLLAEGRLRDFIVVAVWNLGERRFAEYYPQRLLAHLPAEARATLQAQGFKGPPLGDAYLRFLVEELKPVIDARYPTLRGPADTMTLGASLGGLISIYALLEYPRVFGAAAALSAHWVTSPDGTSQHPGAVAAYLKRALPPAGRLRLYLDHGRAEREGRHGRVQDAVEQTLRERGFGPPLVVWQVFDGARHDEASWQARLHVPLGFLLGRPVIAEA